MVYGNTTETPDYVSFIMSGECRLVRDLYLVREKDRYSSADHYSLASDSNIDLFKMRHPQDRKLAMPENNRMLERHFWNIGLLTRGYYFGTGKSPKLFITSASAEFERSNLSYKEINLKSYYKRCS